MAFKLANRAFVLTATTGTGSIALGSVVAGYQSFSAAGITNGDTVRYTIEDGTNWEIGTGTLSNSVGTMSRSVIDSSSGGSALTLSGNAKVFLTAAANDILVEVVEDTSPQLGGNLDVQAREITTSTSNGNVKITPNGSGVVEVKGAGGNDGTLQLNCSANSHGVKIKSPPHSASASYTLTLPNDDGSANEVLKTDGSGNLDWVAQSVADGAVTTAKIADNAVTTAKINADAITNAKMADNSVDSDQYVDGSIDTVHIADSQITTAKINSDAVTNAKLADNSVDSEQYVDGSIDTAHIANLNVTQAKMAAQAINESKLQVSNNPVNGYALTAQSGNTGGLTWAAASGGASASADLYIANPVSATNPTAAGANAVSIGSGASAGGSGSISIGKSSSASTLEATAIGQQSLASGVSSMAAGYHSVASSAQSIAGPASRASGTNSVAFGISTNSASYGATGTSTVSLGTTAKSTATGAFSGGYGATAGGFYSAAIGFYATANGYGSTALGVESKAPKDYSFSSGKHSQTAVEGSRVHGAGIFAAPGDQQSGLYLLAASTTNATPKVLSANQATAAQDTQLAIKSNQVITFHGTVVATQNGVQSVAGWEIKGLLQNDGGTTTLVNSAITVINNASNWGLALTANNTLDCMAITVTGEASHNIRWLASINTSEITYA